MKKGYALHRHNWSRMRPDKESNNGIKRSPALPLTRSLIRGYCKVRIRLEVRMARSRSPLDADKVGDGDGNDGGGILASPPPLFYIFI